MNPESEFVRIQVAPGVWFVSAGDVRPIVLEDGRRGLRYIDTQFAIEEKTAPVFWNGTAKVMLNILQATYSKAALVDATFAEWIQSPEPEKSHDRV